MKLFETAREENLRSKLRRLAFNFFPAYRRTGGRISFLSEDWKEVHVRLGLNRATKNYVGTVFGGSIYGSMDPIYMVQLINILGGDYVVWDKSATVTFLRPIKGTVFAKFVITDEILNEIKSKVGSDNKCTIELPCSFQDKSGKNYAEVSKVLYIADKKYYKSLMERAANR